MLNGLRANGVHVEECRAQLWRGIEDRVAQASGKWLSLSFVGRVIHAYWSLIRQHRQMADYDVMMLGYPGQFDAYLGRLLSWWRGKPVAIDLYMSLYLIATERGLVAKSPLTGAVIRRLEQIGLKLCDLIICDTLGYRDYHCETYQLTADRFRFVPAGADDRLFFPREAQKSSDKFTCAYHGTFLPSHGLETIIDAAEELQEHADIEFVFFGTGPEEGKIKALAKDAELRNVRFSGWVERDEMAEKLAAADVCLGVFGTTLQSRITVQNKIFEGLALGLPVITGASPTAQDALIDQQEVYFVERENGRSLADGILTLKQDGGLRQAIAKNGREKFMTKHTVKALGAQLAQQLREVAQR